MRLRALAALGMVAGCKTSAANGLVEAPMLENAVAAPSGSADAEDAAVPHRPTVDPRPPRNQKCERQVECVPELATAPTLPFQPPYDRCDPTPIGEVGRFSPNETAAHRHNDPRTCCYLAFVSCESEPRGRPGVIRGRPLRDAAGEVVTAATIARKGWGIVGDRSDPNDPLLAAAWAQAGADEHASVGEFARLSLVLLRLGAPAALVADLHRAALDEIAHAEACFSIASRFAGRAVGPARLEVERAHDDASFESLVTRTLRDGCLGEAAAAIELAMRAQDEPDAEIAEALAKMARDEEGHAELAWRILRFAADAAPDVTLAAIGRFLADARPASALEAAVLDDVVRPCLRDFATQRSPLAGDCARES
ncbi:MAG TPA: hypothetical protein VGH28_01305 [Polyangiaceae bacterium]|jgi:hypothetical protein